MERTIRAPLADLADAFLASQKLLVSVQGFTTLRGLTFRMLAWFDAEELDTQTITIQDALRYQAYLSERLTKDGQKIGTGTMLNYLKTARRFFSYLVQIELLATNPFLELKQPRLGKHLSRNVLTEAQMGKLLSALERFDELPTLMRRLRRYRVHVVAELLYATGLRIAEAGALRPADLDLSQRLVYVRAGKGGVPRTAFLTAYACEVLARYLASGRERVMVLRDRCHGDTLFGAGKGQLAMLVNAELHELCTELEIPVITTHGFRHSLGTHLLRAGADMRHIQVILGHEALATTQIYTQVDKDDLKRSLDTFHPRQWVKSELPQQARA
jgi:integrase/recombinase XerD